MKKRKVQKVADLQDVEQFNHPRLERSYDSEVVHIVTGRGRGHDGAFYRRGHIYHITRCNRAMVDAWLEDSIAGLKKCSRCGPMNEFVRIGELSKQRAEKNRRSMKAESAVREARFVAEEHWDKTWERLDRDIETDVIRMIADGGALVPLSRDDIAILRNVLANSIITSHDYLRVGHLLEDVLI
jgi:hypothetical protein